MHDKNYEMTSLKWDSEYFGVNAGRVNINGVLNMKEQDNIICFCKEFDFVTIVNYVNTNENNFWLGNRTNAFLADMNIQFIKTLNVKPNLENKKTIITNSLSENDKIINIARNSFRYSRFFNDKRLPQKLARNVYVKWTKSSFNNKDKYFIISKIGNDIAGYLLFSYKEGCYVIELIAVDQKYQGQKIGKSLINEMECFVIDQGESQIKVGTQINNKLAINFYSVMGFNYSNCSSVFHLWN